MISIGSLMGEVDIFFSPGNTFYKLVDHPADYGLCQTANLNSSKTQQTQKLRHHRHSHQF